MPSYDYSYGGGTNVYISEKDIQDLGGAAGAEFRTMRAGEKEDLKVWIDKAVICLQMLDKYSTIKTCCRWALIKSK